MKPNWGRSGLIYIAILIAAIAIFAALWPTEKPEEVPPAIRKAIEIDRPVIIDFHVNREENVYPMVPPGGAISQMLDEEE